ncbi:MAG: TetR/AcrR family transcriptional regulator [Bacillota bacterium]|nr:TetR/AcrR family transcriptional regulator [Bacillota bacterium]
MRNNESKKCTKQKIFEVSAKLFSREGYNGVSMRKIAKEVGIKESSIYNHYKNKEEILTSLFDYWNDTLTIYRPSEEDIEKMLDYMSVEDVFKQLVIGFGKSLNSTLDSIAKIIYIEQFRNEKARKLMLENLIGESSRFIESVLKIMSRKKIIRAVDMNLIADEYNYTLLALSFEYAHAVNDGEDAAPVIKKMFRHISFICEYLKPI